MDAYKKLNLSDVKDLAPDFGLGEMGEARFARQALGAERIGLTLYRMNAGNRVGFGHRHKDAEEVYVILSGTGRFKVEDELFEVGERDIVHCRPDAMREWEAGPDGLEMLAFGSHAEDDAEMRPGWWTD
jgi:quercetin dioxygenase-like cupin family protein